MDERKLKKRMIRITVITIVSSILLCAIGLLALNYVLQAAHEADHKQMQIEAVEYKERILKQIDKNIQIITTLATAYELDGMIQSDDRLGKSIVKANKVNDFLSFAYMGKNGQGIMNVLGNDTWDRIRLEDCHPFSIDAIEKALQGEKTVSRMFESDICNSKMFVYTVPVYFQGEIVGALEASDTLEIFKDIANGNAVMGGKGYVHVINSSGEFLARSENTLVKENMKTIFDGPYLMGDSKSSTVHALKNQESMFGEFVYKGEKCHYYLEPLGLNDWYLFCANAVWDSAIPLWNVLIICGILLVAILVMVNILLYSGYIQFRKTSKALLRLAYWDTVTGAENTIRFDQNFEQYQSSHKNKNYSTVALNIHNFKGINDLFGKSRGDKVLCFIKSMIETHLKDGEFFCRDTADLFYIFLLDTDEQIIGQRLRKIIDDISTVSSSHCEYIYELSLYCGVAQKEDREKALVALQSIQHTHQQDIAFYNYELHDQVRRKNSIESQMHLALQNGEFKLFLQPKFNLQTDGMSGAEALVRWQNGEGSYHYPNEFIPLFEENGFCLKLDMYMVEQVCKQIRVWMDQGIEPIPISVNQSRLLFSDMNYPDNLMQILNRYQVPPSLITLEILENVATDNLEQLTYQIKALRQKGFHISMDDFGSGYSSLNMLYQLRIDELELDRGFLQKVSEENRQRRLIILEQIIHFAERLGIKTVAEGIETKEDKEAIRKLGCDFGQGYYYAKPMSAKEFSERYMH